MILSRYDERLDDLGVDEVSIELLTFGSCAETLREVPTCIMPRRQIGKIPENFSSPNFVICSLMSRTPCADLQLELIVAVTLGARPFPIQVCEFPRGD